jgi:hypothetical protein
MDLRLTNTTTGHTATDGMTLTQSGANTSLLNRENGFMSIGTNNAEQMRITSAGNVGIGTSTPSTKLDVNGQVKIQGGSPGEGKVLTSDATGLASWKMPGADSQWVRSGSNIYNVNNGNVGIGTSTPATKLDISGQVKIQGGNPGAGKVLTSDANGLATWEAPILSYDEATTNIPANNTDILVITSITNNWKGGKSIMVVGHSYVNAAPGALPPNVLYSDIFVNIEVWIEYNHPTLGNIKFKSVYENTLTAEGVITLPINCILPSVSGLAYTVGARNKNSSYTFYDTNSSTWLTLPLSIQVRPEVQGIEL